MPVTALLTPTAVPAQPETAVTPGTGRPVGPPEVIAAVARAQAGDQTAFAELYDRYAPLLHRYVLSRVRSQALAEDLVSDTFVRAMRRIGGFRWQGRDFGAWLVTIARNLVADHYGCPRERHEVVTEDVVAATGPQLVDGPEREVIDLTVRETLVTAMDRLSVEQRLCLTLRFFRGLSVAETAAAMNRNDGAVKALQYRAVRALAQHVPAELFTD
jgi:RNA polymerase sigma-70 factor (ECF subfamily)